MNSIWSTPADSHVFTYCDIEWVRAFLGLNGLQLSITFQSVSNIFTRLLYGRPYVKLVLNDRSSLNENCSEQS